MFCPYCDDAVRKFSPKHGHFNISPTDPYAHCFRCGTNVGLYKLLIDTNFQNAELIRHIQKLSNFTYSRSGTTHLTKKGQDKNKIIAVKTKIINQYEWLLNNNPKAMSYFMNYIYSRCLDIDPINFLIVPILFDNKLQLKFLNFSGNVVTTRSIDGKRYEISKGVKKYYYFQDVFNIDIHKNIVITEGAFDAVNMYNYYILFNGAFFLAIGGNNYNSAVIDVITSYLLIGSYTIHVVFDYDILKRANRVINTITININRLNPEIKVKFYCPTSSKDVSEIMMLEQIGGS